MSLQSDDYENSGKTSDGGSAPALQGGRADAAPDAEGVQPPDGNTGGNYPAGESLPCPDVIPDETPAEDVDANPFKVKTGHGIRDIVRYGRMRYVERDGEEHPEKYHIYIQDLPDTTRPDVAGIDWLNMVFCFDATPKYLPWLDKAFVEFLGYGIKSERPTGKYNYSRSWILHDDKSLFCCGGRSQRGTALLSIPGNAIQFLEPDKLYCLGMSLDAHITRVDICKDFFHGEYNIERAVEDYEKGLYRSAGGGRSPSIKWVASSEPDGTNKGRTLNVGQRENGKVIRIYEKGLQICPGVVEFAQWVRVELELHNTDRVIPWDILRNPGGYLAGSCKAMNFISGEQCRIKTVAVKVGSSFMKVLGSARRQFGQLVNTMKDMGMTDHQIVGHLRRDGFPKWYPARELYKVVPSPASVLMMVKEVFGDHLEWRPQS